MVVVRRARKSLQERRLNTLQRDLDSNLDRVELKAHQAAKVERAKQRRRKGIELPPIPESVLRGEMTEELFEIDCRLHREAGLYPPRRPPELLAAQRAAGKKDAPAGARSVGLVPFHAFMEQVVRMYQRTKDVPVVHDGPGRRR